jgi:hypothetical protein
VAVNRATIECVFYGGRTMENYKDFLIENNGYNKVKIYNLNGQLIRICKTVAEAKERIDTQTI